MFVLEFLLRIFYEYPILTVGTMLAAGYIVTVTSGARWAGRDSDALFQARNGGSGTGSSTKLPLAQLRPEGEAALRKLVPKEPPAKS